MLDTSVLDRDLALLRAKSRGWVTTPLAEKRALLVDLRRRVGSVAGEWVRLSCEAKGIALDSPPAGEEWTGGPYSLLANITALIDTLKTLEAGRNPLDAMKVRTLPTGQVALNVFPYEIADNLVLGHTGDVWLRPGVTLEQAKAGAARRLLDTSLPGEVALVLGAGNVNSITPMDVLSKLYGDNAVVLMKLSSVNNYLEPVLRDAFAEFIDRGFVRIIVTSRQAGSYLTQHPEVDTVHITGSEASHDAVVFGTGEEGAARKADCRPLMDKPISSELGGVGPAVIVPGQWSDAALRMHAEQVAAQRLHNSGSNCVATQVVILPQDWPQAEKFVDYLREAVRAAPVRPAHYPGSAESQQTAVDAHPKAEMLGGDENVPRTLLTDLDANDQEEQAFGTEYFGPVLGVTSLPGATAEEFLDNAVDFCNERLYGTLGVNVLVDSATTKRLGPAFDSAIARLRYGTVAINAWVGVAYALPRATWGAFPGHEVHDVGSGIGVVHNSLLIDPDHIERTVVRAPFYPWPKPFWFVSNRNAHVTGKRLTYFAAAPGLPRALPKVVSVFLAAVRG